MRLDQLCSAFGGSDGKGPLQGLWVLDPGSMVAGPLAATHLVDFGSDVIAIEPPSDAAGQDSDVEPRFTATPGQARYSGRALGVDNRAESGVI